MRIFALFSAALLLLCASCASTAPAVTSDLPGVPSLDARRAAATEEVILEGSSTFQRSAGAVDIATSLQLDAGGGELEWGIWRFTPAAGKPLYTVNVALNPGATDEAWLALADFQLGQWVLSGPFSDPQSIDITGNNDLLSPNGHVYIAVIASDNHQATVDSLGLELEGNAPPVASFTATPQTGAPGDAVVLDAAASSDSDGTITTYEWDIDGDGIYETDFGGPTGNMALPFPAGTVTVGLRVTDDRGAQGETTLALESNGDVWTFVDVVSANCLFPSMAIVNGAPAIAYRSEDSKSLRYAYTSDPGGLSGWNNVGVHTASGSDDFGYFCSLAVINGKPAIAYGGTLAGSYFVFYADSALPDGSNDWNPGGVLQDIAAHTSLAPRPDGTPGITYHTFVGDDLRYVYSTDLDGTSWNNYTIELNGSDTGLYTSAELIGGQSCVSYSHTGALKFARQVGGDSGGGWDKEIVDLNGAGYFSSLVALASGNPAIAYTDTLDEELYYAWSDSGGLDADWHPVVVASGARDGYSCSLTVIQGTPMICYRAGTVDFSELKLAIADDANGTSWTTSTIDTGLSSATDSFTSCAEVNGNFAVAYIGGAGDLLKYAILFRDETP